MAQYLIAFNDEWCHRIRPSRSGPRGGRWAVIDEMREAGVRHGNGALDASTVVCNVESRDGEPVFTDGPYAETKEHLGGFTVVDVPDDAAARYWAGRLAVALEWPQEVHRFPTMDRPRPDDPRK